MFMYTFGSHFYLLSGKYWAAGKGAVLRSVLSLFPLPENPPIYLMRASCASTAPSVPFPVTTAPAAAPGDHGVAGAVTTFVVVVVCFPWLLIQRISLPPNNIHGFP